VSAGDQQKYEVQRATDIVALIGEQVALKPKGREFVGLCPFHEDHSPSLNVSAQKQIYKCFVCGAGGDVFSFMMSYHKMTFPEALKHLADRAGIRLQRRRAATAAADGGDVDPRDRLFDANGKALKLFRGLLQHTEHGQVARQYLAKRGISDDMVERFAIGYAPDRWDGLVTMIEEKRWNRRDFELAGLIAQRDDGSDYDKLRHRLIFPILDAMGRAIAFGGRVLRDEDTPKYLNSPETILFNKSATLYGLHAAKKPIITSRTAVIVEGYTDVIACHQGGHDNVVATLGTALTVEHVRQLRRYAERVVLVFDADEAGQKAADRAVEIFLAEQVDVAIAVLPAGNDPADLLTGPNGAKRWTEVIAGATDALAFQFEQLRTAMGDAVGIAGHQRLAENYMRRLGQAGLARQNPVRLSAIARRLGELLGVSESRINLMIKDFAPVRRTAGAAPPASDVQKVDGASSDASSATAAANINKKLATAERQLIGALLRDPAVFGQTLADGARLGDAVTPSDLTAPDAIRLYDRLYPRLKRGEAPSLTELLVELAAEGEPALAELATQVEIDVDRRTHGSDENLRALACDVAQTILAAHREQDYRQQRDALVEAAVIGGAGQMVDADALRRIAQHNTDNPSPVRFPRFRPAAHE